MAIVALGGLEVCDGTLGGCDERKGPREWGGARPHIRKRRECVGHPADCDEKRVKGPAQAKLGRATRRPLTPCDISWYISHQGGPDAAHSQALFQRSKSGRSLARRFAF